MASKPGLKIMLILASNRIGRMSDRIGKAVLKELKSAGHEVTLMDPAELKLPLLECPMHFYPDQNNVPQQIQEICAQIKEQDAYFVCSPEYNRSIPPALTNFFDHFPVTAFAYKPSAILSYSMGTGGHMGASQLRNLLTEFGSAPTAFIVTIPEVQKNVSEDGVASERIVKNIQKSIVQLEWVARALKAGREAEEPPAFVNL